MTDPIQLIPLALQRVAAFFIFGEGIFLVAWHARLTERIAARANVSERARWLTPTLVGGFLAAWLGTALIVADSAHFPMMRVESLQAISALVALVPFVTAVVWLFASKTARAINTATAPETLIPVQLYRVAGGLFLFPFLTYGALPGAFAWPAGVGDGLRGAFAPLRGL